VRPLTLVVLAAVGCSGTIEGGGPGRFSPEAFPPAPRAAGEPVTIPTLPSAAQCANVPTGRAWLGLGGEHLEASRRDTAAFLDLHRPYRGSLKSGNDWVLTGDITGAVGADAFSAPESRDPGTGGAFGVAPDRWSEEPTVGPFAVFVTYSFAWKACVAAITRPPSRNVPGWYEHTAFEPTPDRARAFCRRTQANAWRREPTTDEVDACVDLALNLAEEPDLTKRWAYVCASVVSSMNWLSY
jgi:hypothetical protein